jgi:flagellar hook-length control protein FliK
LLSSGKHLHLPRFVMAALAAVNTIVSSPPKGRTNASSQEPDSSRFGDMYSREVNRPAAQPREQTGQQDSAAQEKSEPSSSEPVPAEQAQSAAVIDPLLASLLMMQTPSAPVSQDVRVAGVEEDAADLGRGRAKTAVLPGAIATSLQSPATTGTDPLADGQAITATGKNLPALADVSANSALQANPLGQELAADTVTSDESFDQTLQAALLLQPRQAQAREVSSPAEAKQTVARHTVSETVGEKGWGEAVAQRVSLMLGRQEQKLEMQLNPPNLGPMEVRLSLGGEQASVVFASQHAGVREALAAATPRLTALLADQGIVLTNVQVASDSLNQQPFQQAFQQHAGEQGRARQGMTAGQAADDDVKIRELGAVRMPVARSGVSLYV